MFGGILLSQKKIMGVATNTALMLGTAVLVPVAIVLGTLPEESEFLKAISPWLINFRVNIIAISIVLVIIAHCINQIFLLIDENDLLKKHSNNKVIEDINIKLDEIETKIKTSEDDGFRSKMKKLVETDEHTNAAAIYTYTIHDGSSGAREKVIKIKHKAGYISEDYDFNYIGQDRYAIPRDEYSNYEKAHEKSTKICTQLNKLSQGNRRNDRKNDNKKDVIRKSNEFIKEQLKYIRDYESKLNRNDEQDGNHKCSNCIMHNDYSERDAINYALMVARINIVEYVMYELSIYDQVDESIFGQHIQFIEKYEGIYAIKRIGFLIAILMGIKGNGSFTKEHKGLSSKAGRVYYFENIFRKGVPEKYVLALAMNDKSELHFIEKEDHFADSIYRHYEGIIEKALSTEKS